MIYYSLLPETADLETYDKLEENTVTQYLNVLSDLARAHNFQVLVAVMPVFDNIVEYTHQSHHDTVKTMCLSRNFHNLDLLPSFQELAKKEEVSIDIVHPTPAGHRLIGETLSEFIEHNLFNE